MKKSILPLLLLVFGLNGYSQSNITAMVEGNIVTVIQTGTQRNCGARYHMDVYQEGLLVQWFQVDTGAIAFCMCDFDMSVIFGPMDPGNYTCDVYSLEKSSPGDTTFQGSCTFNVAKSVKADTLEIMGTSQSPCYNIVISANDPQETSGDLTIIPNPFSDYTTISFDAVIAGNYTLTIFNNLGQPVWTKKLLHSNRFAVHWNGRNNHQKELPGGIYHCILTAENGNILAKTKVIMLD